jgi:hypothetical protein
LKWFFSIAVVVLLSVAATTPSPEEDNPDAQYVHIMAVIGRADALRLAGKADAAKAKYREAQKALVDFRARNPLWSPKTVTYRLNEVTDRIETRPAIPELTAPAKKPQTKLEAEPTASAAKSAVKLLDAGAEPRKALRLHVKAGDKQTIIMTIKMNMDMSGTNPGGQPPKIPAMSIPADTTVQSVAANGDITYESVLEEAGVVDEPGAAPEVVQAIKTQLGKLKGLTSTGVMSNRGMTKKVDIKAPQGADAQMQQITDQIKEGASSMDAPFPEEAVGAGAKWEVKKTVQSQGMSVDQTATYQLVSLDGDRLNTTFTITQSAGNQKIHNAAMGGAQLNVLELTAKGTGSRTTDLSKLNPSQATMDMHTDMKSEMSMGNKTQPMNMKMDMNLGMEAR